ncbi:MAG: hypothetical protein JWM20_996 [Patescibacteria group bacterium]|nr:hypothetical protein [Patescibacteria group bacterium]
MEEQDIEIKKPDWASIRKSMAHMINRSTQSDTMSIHHDGGTRFVLACEMYQRMLFPMAWNKETALEHLNPITQSFDMEQWVALIEHTTLDKVRRYAFDAGFQRQIELLEECNWQIYHHTIYGLGRFLHSLLKFPNLLHQFPDELVMIFEKGFLAYGREMHSTGRMAPQIVLLNELLSVAQSLEFESLVNDFTRIQNEMFKEFVRVVGIDYAHGIKHRDNKYNYSDRTKYCDSVLFKLIFSWTAWKDHSECATKFYPIIYDCVHSGLLTSIFELLIACDDAKKERFDLEKLRKMEFTMWDHMRDFTEEYGIDMQAILGREDFVCAVKYFATKIK